MEERILEPPEPQDPAPDVAAVLPAEVASGDVAMDVDDDDDSDGEFEFEFPFVSRDSPAGTAALADDLFADGRIKPFYPVFGRAGGGGDHQLGKDAPPPVPPRTRGPLGRLFLEESRGSFDRWRSTSSSSSSAAASDEGGLDGAPPESYCLWTPGGAGAASASASPRPPRKSGSTGSMARWRRISELVVGRSHSDGKEKFLFLPTPPPTKDHDDMDHFKPKLPKPKPKPTLTPGGKKLPAAAVAEIDTITAMHRTAYGAKGSGGGGTPRLTFLPYREELVGLFANVNGISRSHPHPF